MTTLADMTANLPNVRFTPNSGHRSERSPCPLCANKRPMAWQQKSLLFDYFIGDLLEKRWHLETQCLGGLEVDDKLELGW